MAQSAAARPGEAPVTTTHTVRPSRCKRRMPRSNPITFRDGVIGGNALQNGFTVRRDHDAHLRFVSGSDQFVDARLRDQVDFCRRDQHAAEQQPEDQAAARAQPGGVQREFGRHGYVQHAERRERVLALAFDVDRSLHVEQLLDHAPGFGFVSFTGHDQVANFEAVARHQIRLQNQAIDAIELA